jgi:hypothetical protein
MQTKNKIEKKSSSLAVPAGMLLALWLGFWLLIGAAMLALLSIPAAQLYGRSALSLTGFLALGAALVLAYALRPRGWNQPAALHDQTQALKREDFAPLYALAESIGRELGITVPLSICITASTDVTIIANRNWRGQVNRMQLGLGLPLFGTLSESELGTLITHEFALLAKADLPLGPWLHSSRRQLSKAMADLDYSVFLPDLVFRVFAVGFLRLSATLARSREFSADAQAAKRFGVITARAALEKVHLIAPMWSAYLDFEIRPAIARGARLPIFSGLRSFCQPTSKRSAVQAAIRRNANSPSAEFDVTPSLAERINALTPGGKPAYPALAQCFHLLGGELVSENIWYHQFKKNALTNTAWDQYGSLILQPELEQRFAKDWMNPAQLPLTQLPALAYQAEDMWEKIKPDTVSFLSTQGQRNYILDTLEEWITACLFYRGFSATVSPGQALSMQRADQIVLPADLLAAAIAGNMKSAALKQFDLPEAP